MRNLFYGLGACVLVLAGIGEAAVADVELTRVGNDPATGWCDINARALALRATMNVQIQGRSKSSMRHASLMPSEMKRRRDVRCDSIEAEQFAMGLLGQNEV